ncbi:MAG: hypothetical protein AAF743_12280, partial [Planctomycetota bacterium]
ETLLEWAGQLGGETFEDFIDSSSPADIADAFGAALARLETDPPPFDVFDLGAAIDIEALNGIGLELGIDLGDGLAVRGAIAVGRADANMDVTSDVDDVYFLGIEGEVKVSSYGGGGTLILTTAGPVAVNVNFGVPIPLGPTTLTLGGGGTIVFGRDLLDGVDTSGPTINPADIPAPEEWMLTDPGTISGILQGFWNPTTNSLDPVWNLPATLAIEGQLSSLAVLGLVNLTGNIAATIPPLDEAIGGTGLSFLGQGSVNAFGLPFATGGVLVDARDLLNPTVSFGFKVPPPDNPIAFLFPVQADLAGTLRTDGMIEAWIIGLRTLIDGAIAGGTPALNQLFGQLAARLEDSRDDGRVNELFDALGLDPTQTVTVASLQSALQSAFDIPEVPAPTGDLPQGDPWTALGELAQLLWTEVQFASGGDLQIIETLGGVFADLFVGAAGSADDAIRNAFERFNPTFVLRGAVQPTLLGFPVGNPTNEVDLVINKNAITLDLTVSDLLANAFTPFKLLGLSDRFEVGFTAPLPGALFEVLLDPNATSTEVFSAFGDALNPFTGWEAALSGSVSLLGFELAEVSGIAFGPQDGGPSLFTERTFNFGLADGTELTGANTALPGGFEDRVPVYFDSRFNDMLAYGGLLVTGELRVPDLLRDPVPVIEELVTFTQQTGLDLEGPWNALIDPDLDLTDLANAGAVATGLQDYFTQVVALLGRTSPLGTLQIYAPSPATLVD